MKQTSSQQRQRPGDRPGNAVDRPAASAEGVDDQSASRLVHPQGEAPEIVPSGSFPHHGKPGHGAMGAHQVPHPVRAGGGDDATEIISVLPDSSSQRRPKHRNRRPLGSLKSVGLILACQLVLLLLGLAVFGGAIRSWLQGGAEAPPEDRVTSEQALALREDLQEASSKFSSLGSDLEVVKKQVSINPGDAWKQLEILGERNQLTTDADDAIANGNREAFDRLVSVSKDRSQDKRLKDGATAEILRVKSFYASGTRLGSYALPVATLYPSLKTEQEEALSNSQLLAILENQEKHWRLRLRAAFLLGSRRDLAVNEALVRAAASDPNLDVVKECVFAFEENTGYRSKGLFEIDALVNWWTVYQARVAPKSEDGSDPS
ncbi:MAG: hypothetical protein ACR2RV_23365 [Verrucomicrobiales bacterium]